MTRAAIFLLAERSAQDSSPCIEPISRREALLQLVRNTYMSWYLDRHQRAEEFDVLTRLVASINCFRVIPSSDPARLSTLAERIESHVSGLFKLRSGPALGDASTHV